MSSTKKSDEKPGKQKKKGKKGYLPRDTLC